MDYIIEIDPVTGHADMVRGGRRWYFTGGYGDAERKITQIGCARVAAYLGDTRITRLSILDVLDAAREGDDLEVGVA